MGVQPCYLETAWGSLEREFGSFERYLECELGIHHEERQQLRERLLC